MNDNLTDITMVIDRSGSMDGMMRGNEAQRAINRFIESQKEAAGDATLSLLQFDDELDWVHEAEAIESVGEYKLEPRHTTALLDAIGTAITHTGRRLANMPESDRPGKVVLVVMTDGLENASREYRRSTIAAMIKEQTDTYNWQFVYLGANQDAIAVGGKMGVHTNKTATFAATGQGILRTMAVTSDKLAEYRSTGNDAALEYNYRERAELAKE